MGFFDFLKEKPNTKKEEPEIQNADDMASAFDRQMAEGDKSIQGMLKEIDDTIAEIDRRLELEKEEKNTRE